MDLIFNKAKKSIDAENIEVFRQSWDEDSVEFEMDKVKEIKSQKITGYGLRVIKDKKVGFASSTGEEYNGIVEKALSVSPFGPESLFVFSQEKPKNNSLKIFDPLIQKMSIEDMTKKGYEILKYVKDMEPDFQYDLCINRSVEGKGIMTDAWQASYNKTRYLFSIAAHSYKEGDFFNVGDGYYCSLYKPIEKEIADNIIETLSLSRNADKICTGEYPIIFSPSAFQEILESIMIALNGKMVEKGSSPLGDKLGKKVFPESVSIYDDGTIDGSHRAVPFDDEGVKVTRNILIEGGVVKNYFLDMQRAGSLNKKSTGNASRSYASQPTPSTHTVIFKEGTDSKESLISGIKEGIYIKQLIGSHTGNFFSGDFQMNVDMGFKISRGQITGRVKNVMIGGNVYKLFKNIAGISKKRRWVGKYYLPFVKFDKVIVSGN